MTNASDVFIRFQPAVLAAAIITRHFEVLQCNCGFCSSPLHDLFLWDVLSGTLLASCWLKLELVSSTEEHSACSSALV